MVALVTGGCSGIGNAIARRLAADGHALVLASERAGALEEAAAALREAHGVPVHVVCVDLARPEGASELHARVRELGLEVDLLVNNAGFFFFGEAVDASPERAAAMLQLHVVTPSLLCTLFGREMRERGRGRILVVSSISAWRDFPGIAYYGSSKKYLRGFARALRSEMAPHGVTVTCLAPGPVATNLYGQDSEAVRRGRRLGLFLEADRVADAAVRATMRGDAECIPGASAWLMAKASALLPQWLVDLVRRRGPWMAAGRGRALRGLAAIAALALASCASAPTRGLLVGTVVTTDLGLVRGVERNGAVEFRGIPYGAPPAGAFRFAAPRGASRWTGVRDGSAFGAACPQTHRFALTEPSTTEDCLFLNVSAPADVRVGERLPVLVWIPGGAFVGGAGSLYRLDRLATRGRLVVVSMNYRLGVLGFMAVPGLDPDTNGDLGLEDQRLALRWVQRNVALFGGDPDNVTVAGESAGAGSVCMHLVSPDRVAGLFHKAAVQSAGCLQPMSTVASATDDSNASSPPAWKQVAEKVGCGAATDVVACLRAAPIASLLTAQDAVSAALMSFGPSVGNGSVPLQARDAIRAGRVMRVPLLLGGTRDELRLYVAYAKLFTPFVSDYSEAKLRSFWLPNYYGADAPDPSTPGKTLHDAIVQEYASGGAMDGASLGSMFSDHQTAVGITNCLYLRTSDALLDLVPSIHQVEFADPAAPVLGVGIAKGMDPGFALGAVHSSELNYLFPNFSNTSAMDGPDLAPASQALADAMVDAWASFAATGTPRAAGLPAWPRYARGGRDVMQLVPGASGPYDAAARHRCAFWERLYP